MTCGAEGARAWTSRGQATVPAERCELVDTVGAGDTFQAALLTWLAEHEVLEAGRTAALGEAALSEALRFASCAAAITCSRPGADLPRRSEL
jgi:fructokinase